MFPAIAMCTVVFDDLMIGQFMIIEQPFNFQFSILNFQFSILNLWEQDVLQGVMVDETTAVHIATNARHTAAGGVLPHHEGGIITQFGHIGGIAGNHIFIARERT